MIFYTYVYFSNGFPFYVGKGKKKRMESHYKDALARKPRRSLCAIECIKFLKLGLEISFYKVIENVSEKDAWTCEMSLIAHYGKRVNGGLLVNLTDGGDGCSGYKQSFDHVLKRVAKQRGQKRSEDQRMRMRITPRFPSAKRAAASKERANKPEAIARVSKQFKGKKHSAERNMKKSIWNKANGVRPPQKYGVDHPRAKVALLKMPDQSILKTDCLTTFCIENNLNKSSVRNTFYQNRPLKRGKWAGLQLIKM